MQVLTHLRALSLYNNRLRAVPTEMEHLIKSLGRFRVSKNPMDSLPQRWSSRWDLSNQYHRPSGWTEEGVTDWSLFSNTWYPHAVKEWEKWAGEKGKEYKRAEAARTLAEKISPDSEPSARAAPAGLYSLPFPPAHFSHSLTACGYHVLENRDGLRVAVVVNDMAAVNVDANLIEEQGTLVHAEEKMIALSNGCICCTLREDLFSTLAGLAARPEGLDHILIESSGISEPLPVAETFTFEDAAGTSLSDIARLDTLVTVVDGASFLDELHAADSLRARGWEASDDDARTVAQLPVKILQRTFLD